VNLARRGGTNLQPRLTCPMYHDMIFPVVKENWLLRMPKTHDHRESGVAIL